jgi:hypothetical protein
MGYHCYQFHTKFYPISFSQGYVHMQTKMLGIISAGFEVTDQLLIRFLAFVRYWTAIQRLQESFSKKESFVQYSHTVQGIHKIRLIKMCLHETYSKLCIGKHLSDTFPIQNGLKQGEASMPLLFNFALEYAIRRFRKTRWDSNYMGHISCWSMLMM